MKRRIYLILMAAVLMALGSCTGSGPHMRMYGGMDSHDGPYYGAGWEYDTHDHGKKHKKHMKHKKIKKCRKHGKHHKHHHDDD